MLSENSFEVNATGGVPPYTYRALGHTDNFQSDNVFRNLGTGTFLIVVQDANGCFSQEEVTVVVTSVDDPQSQPELSLYPNPVKDFLTLNNLKESDKVFITDVQGRQFAIEKQKVTTGKYSINVSKLKEGLFILGVRDLNGRLRYRKKFVKGLR